MAGTVYTSHGDRAVPAGNTDTVVYLTLPPGTYALSATIGIRAVDFTNTAFATCSYSTDGNETFVPAQVAMPPGTATGAAANASVDADTPFADIALAGTVTVVDGNLGVDCIAVGHDVTFDANFTATSVGASQEQVH